MLQAGVFVSDYATLMVEILKDNARPEAGTVYDAMDMPWAKLIARLTASDCRPSARADRHPLRSLSPLSG